MTKALVSGVLYIKPFRDDASIYFAAFGSQNNFAILSESKSVIETMTLCVPGYRSFPLVSFINHPTTPLSRRHLLTPSRVKISLFGRVNLVV